MSRSKMSPLATNALYRIKQAKIKNIRIFLIAVINAYTGRAIGPNFAIDMQPFPRTENCTMENSRKKRLEILKVGP